MLSDLTYQKIRLLRNVRLLYCLIMKGEVIMFLEKWMAQNRESGHQVSMFAITREQKQTITAIE